MTYQRIFELAPAEVRRKHHPLWAWQLRQRALEVMDLLAVHLGDKRPGPLTYQQAGRILTLGSPVMSDGYPADAFGWAYRAYLHAAWVYAEIRPPDERINLVNAVLTLENECYRVLPVVECTENLASVYEATEVSPFAIIPRGLQYNLLHDWADTLPVQGGGGTQLDLLYLQETDLYVLTDQVLKWQT